MTFICGDVAPSAGLVCTKPDGHPGFHGAQLEPDGPFLAAWELTEVGGLGKQLDEVLTAFSGLVAGQLIDGHAHAADSDLERCKRVAQMLGVAVDHFEDVGQHETAETIREYAAAVAHAGDAL